MMRSEWKKYVLCLSVIIMGLSILSTGTSAQYVSEKTSHNVITTGLLRMELVEETTGGKPWPVDGLQGMIPGVPVDKTVYVKNLGSVPIFVRIMMDQALTTADGAEEKDEYLQLNLNTADWTAYNGFYYYNHMLQPGSETEPLFTTVTLAPEAGNACMHATAEIRVLAQATQCANNGSSALFALGWPEASMAVQALYEMQ